MPTLWFIDIRMSSFLYSLIDYYNHKYEISIVHTNRLDIAMSRNKILYSVKDDDYLLFLDDDNIPENIDFLDKLVDSWKDIISWLVPSRLPDANWIHRLCIFDECFLNTLEHKYLQYINIPNWPEIFEISNCWMWCVLINCDIIRKMIKKYDYPCQIREVRYYIFWNKHYRDDEVDYSKVTDWVLRYKRYMSEDLLFFDRVRWSFWIEIYAHKWVTCSHISNNEIITVNKHIKWKNFNLWLLIKW